MKKLNAKYPLVSVIGCKDQEGRTRGKVVRLFVRKQESGKTETGFDGLRCHRNKEFGCSVDCSAISLSEWGKNYMLICLSTYPEGMPLGVLDAESVDLNLLDSLRWGSDLHESVEASR